MSNAEILQRSLELRSERASFVVATVVRVAKPTSATPGDSAIIRSDGEIEGFIGGTCAESTVRKVALQALEHATSTLLVISPDGEVADNFDSGVRSAQNTCISGGTIELFLEPQTPPPLLGVVGRGPIGNALQVSGASSGFDVRSIEQPDDITSAYDALIVATYGQAEPEMLIRALECGVSYIGLVASKTRGAQVVSSLGLGEALSGRIHTPAGLPIGAVTPQECALSILSEIVSLRRSQATASPAALPAELIATGVAIDPVCHMSVAINPQSLRSVHEQEPYYFCGPGCQDAFDHDPKHYLAPST